MGDRRVTKVALWSMFAVLLVGCEQYEGKRSRMADIQYVFAREAAKPDEVVDIAMRYANNGGLDIRGPYERPGSVGKNYVMTIFGGNEFEIVIDIADKHVQTFFYCSYTLPLDKAQEQAAEHAQNLFNAYANSISPEAIKVLQFEDSSWKKVQYRQTPNFLSISECDNRNKP
jgi:hypothetical protein